MKKLFSLFSGVLATLVAAPAIAQLPFDFGHWDATEFGYGLNPPIHAPVDSIWGNIGVYGEFLYFRVSEDNTHAYQQAVYSTLGSSSATTATTSGTSGTTDFGSSFSSNSFQREDFGHHYKPGYRVGLFLNLPCDQWTIDANYTYFYSKNTQNSPIGHFFDAIDPFAVTFADPFLNHGTIYTLPYNLNLFTESEASLGELTTQVGSTWTFRFNEVDVDLTREFWVGPAVAFRPFIGFRGLFIQQRLNSTGIANFLPSDITTGDAFSSVIQQNLKCNSDGYGLHGGSEVTFKLFDGFDLFGQWGIGLLWTHFTTQFDRLDLISNATGATLLSTISLPNNKESFDVMRFVADLSAGVEWATLFNCNQNAFFLRFAWEHKIFLSQNAFRTYVNGETDFHSNGSLGGLLDTTGDLALYGFSVGGGFTF